MRKVPAALVIAAVMAVYLLRLDRAAGLIIDDAWYVLLARTLAEGRGFFLVSSPTAPILPSAPIGFPLILSLVFKLDPQFPHNVWLLKAVSIAAMAGAGAVTYRYLTEHRALPRPLGGGIAVAVMLAPGFVFLATSTVMPECVFVFGQMLTIVIIERCVRAKNPASRWRLTVIAAVLAAATCLVRSMAVALVLAAVLYLAKEKLWKHAAAFATVALLCLAPWMLYSRAHQPTLEQAAEHGGSIAYSYTDQLWMRWAGAPAMGRAGTRDLPARVWDNIVNVFGRDVGAMVIPIAFRGPTESGQEVVALGGRSGLSQASMGGAPMTMAIAALLSVLVLIGFFSAASERVTVAEFLMPISLGIILIWPFWTYRFTLPLLPFAYFYLVSGLRAVTARLSSDPWRASRIAVLCIIGFSTYDHLGYVLERLSREDSSAIAWIADAEENQQVLDWMKQNLTGEGVVATTNPPLVHLATGRRAVSIDSFGGNWNDWRKLGVRYIAFLQSSGLPSTAQGRYRVLYESPGGLWVVEMESASP